jgi:cytochrome P450
MRPKIEAIVAEHLNRCAARGSFDAVTDFAIPIPVDVIGTILGVATSDTAQFRAWSEAMMLGFHPARSPAQEKAMLAANDAVSAHIAAIIADRTAYPRDDLISDIVLARKDRARLSDAELRVNCMSLLTGGNMTTADLIGSAILLLLQNPDELAKLKANPALWPSAVEEALRLSPPVDGTQRILESDRAVAGCPMHKGQVVAVQLPAANLDPTAFPDPERFDIARKPNVHMSFGGGAHICIGAPLARMEAQVALTALFTRFPNLRLTGTPRWRDLPFFHGLETLPVSI